MMLRVKNVEETKELITEEFADYYLNNEKIKLEDAVGRITIEDIVSEEDIPSFNRSTVDGYAVIASDTYGASEALPAQLKLVGEVKMGERPIIEIQGGESLYIPTGGELPTNTETVVMIEYTENLKDGYIYINKSSAPGNNVVFKGDDVNKGTVIIKKNTLLRPQDIGTLAAMGYVYINVKRKLKIGIVSTGDEIIEIDKKPIGSQVRDVNTYTLYADIIRPSCIPIRYGIIKDEGTKIKEQVEKALSECDIVLISGGSSVGTKDETYRVINSIGSPGVLMHGIAVKPGKPTIIGKVNNKGIIGLPGHPVSAFVIHRIFVEYLINTMCGIKSELFPSIKGEMNTNFPSNNGREEYVPVMVNLEKDNLIIKPVFGKSGLISTLSRSQGYIHIPRGSEGINKGDIVEVFLWK